MGFTSMNQRREWERKQARMVAPGLATDTEPVNTVRDRLEVTLGYRAEPAAMTRKALDSERRHRNFAELEAQQRAAEGNFADMRARLEGREDQWHCFRNVDGLSRSWAKESMRLSNREHLHALWQPKLDAKADAEAEIMARPVPDDRVPFWYLPAAMLLLVLVPRLLRAMRMFM